MCKKDIGVIILKIHIQIVKYQTIRNHIKFKKNGNSSYLANDTIIFKLSYKDEQIIW